MASMNCSTCGGALIKLGGDIFKCEICGKRTITVATAFRQPIFIKQEPYVDNKGIWMPYNEYVQEGCASDYRLVMSKEMFIEAYNKFIKGEFDDAVKSGGI